MNKIKIFFRALIIVTFLIADTHIPFGFCQEEELLDLIEKNSIRFFIEEINPHTGLTRDRANNFKKDTSNLASIASSGFGLSSFCIAVERKWISRAKAKKIVLKSLNFFFKKVEHVNGFFYHFVDIKIGKRIGNCEVSSIDTAIFLAGAIVVKEYFNDKRITELVDKIYERINWQWMLDGEDILSMGYMPETGFLEARWDSYSELMLVYILAIGSSAHPILADSWHAWKRSVYTYGGFEYINCPPLFTHQYSHAWIDFRNKNDDYADYFENSKIATLANKRVCMDLEDKFKTFKEGLWGLSASDGPYGYKAYGGPPANPDTIDGTISPSAVCGSIVFAPDECLSTIRLMYEKYRDKLWGRYGFSDSLNLDKKWFATDVIGIDQGISALMIENYRSGFIWDYFMRNKNIKKALMKVGFRYHPKELNAIDLEGEWFFKKGDKPGLEKKNISLAGWIKMKIPSYWELQGLRNYDGYAWYRTEFELSQEQRFIWHRNKIVLFIGGIDDFDTVYLNGKQIGNFYSKIGKTYSYWDRYRCYIIPRALLDFYGKNTIAIRVFDAKGNGGIWKGPVKIGPYDELNCRPVFKEPCDYVLIYLDGKWFFKMGDNLSWKEITLSDRGWKKIFVPGAFEEGISKEYDGFFWYRLHLVIPESVKDKKKYLYIGAIDGADEIYLNGELIGKSGTLPSDFKTAYSKPRKYLLKESLIRYNNTNVIAIRAFDVIKKGGIAQGPVAIVTQEQVN